MSTGRRTSTDFCPSCDYPLFWVGGPQTSAPTEVDSDALYRAPGASGTNAPSTVPCPECGERNLPTDVTCVRCGADLSPAPPAPAPQPPAPQPVVFVPQPVPCTHLPTWLVALVSAVVTVGLTLTVLVLW